MTLQLTALGRLGLGLGWALLIDLFVISTSKNLIRTPSKTDKAADGSESRK